MPAVALAALADTLVQVQGHRCQHVHDQHDGRRERIGNTNDLRQRSPPRGPRPRDIGCQTRTRNAAGVDAHSWTRGGELEGYHLLPTARAELLRRLGRHGEAAESYRRALDLVSNEAERRHLERRLREVAPA
jgi:hypothetical protein